MPKRISSPSLRWPGFVVVSDPLTLPQALAWEKAENIARPIRAKIKADMGNKSVKTVDITEIHNIYLPAVLMCVDKWELENLPEQMTISTFPASPRNDSLKLMGWLINSISAIYDGEEEKADPNG